MKTNEELHQDNVVELCAKAAHEVNRAYCRTLGDHSQPPWEEAPDWQRTSALIGAKAALDPSTTPEKSHEGWLAQKLAEGWVYGPVKDAELRTHPCCLPYAELPPAQRVKDDLFLAAVRSTAAALEAYARQTAAAVLT